MDAFDAGGGEWTARGASRMGLSEVVAARAEFWRGQGVHVAECLITEQWLRYLRCRCAAAFEVWQQRRRDYDLVRDRLLREPQQTGEEAVVLFRQVGQAAIAEKYAHQRYRTVLAAVNAEICRVREGIIEGNHAYLVRLDQVRLARATALEARARRLAEGSW